MEELVRKAQQGDRDAFYEIISVSGEKLYKTAYSYLKNEHAALEAVAETTCRAYISINKLRDCRYFTTWLTRILINYCLNELKYLSRHTSDDMADFRYICIKDADCGIEERLDLSNGLARIKPKYRDVLILKYFEDFSTEDIAKALNKPVGTVKTWINRGLKQLRESMKGSGHYVC